ncbi:hypothetical protein BGW36DRAFT_208713 [Talaromyces proteolyticus]|uniref:Zn(2)-C6 fungal-type domain-containing protein n=1 Tax=Talaromyces proteolyticus TaxID=1131652 RepID=A0AAD4KJA3_9EURO|nr:uncharacterized protein BGW36DRAFT_208713 [Talaromyces proteolyticus]KAH8693646.1 hypothetical protein BGW36DRAFT_208713 [Talaromyces proteolyticus]
MSESKKGRSRNGCFTCRTRKVRCINADQRSIPSTSGRGADRFCSNCERLGLECRWSAPEAGEEYTPPPKRRRQSVRKNLPPTAATNAVDPDASLAAASSSLSCIEAQQPTLTEADQSLPQLDFSDPLFGVDLDHWEMDLPFDSLDFMISVPSSPLASHPTQVNPPSGDSRPPLEISWNLQSLTGDFRGLSSSITDENRRLIEHYLQALQGYSKLADHPRDSNLFLSAFSASLSFPPLFYAVLAFSSAHLAMNDPSFTDQAQMYDRMSSEYLEIFRLQQNISIEGLLSAIFVKVKKIHITGGSIEPFLNLMQMAADILSSDQGRQYLRGSPTLGRRIITRLIVLDARAASYRLGGGQFIHCARAISALSDMFPNTVRIDPATDGIMCLLQVSLLRMRVADLDLRIHQQMQSEIISTPPVRTEEVTSLYASLQAHIRAWEVSMKVSVDFENESALPPEGTLDAVGYRDYTVLSALHSTRLYLYFIYPLPICPVHHSVSTVLHCELMIQKDPSRANSPASLLPSSLFLAGLCTSNILYRDWVLRILKQGERWGIYIRKVGDLLGDIVQTRLQGLPVDIRNAMERATGTFVI